VYRTRFVVWRIIYMFRKKNRKDKLVKQTTKKSRGKEIKPREINLDALPYYPLVFTLSEK